MKNLKMDFCRQHFFCPVPGQETIPNYLLGDPVYPLTPYCKKKYQSCSLNDEVLFNIMIRAARNSIECAFGWLEACWAILTRKIDFKLESVPILIYACFVFHNFCGLEYYHLDENLVRMQTKRNKVEEEKLKNTPDPIYSYVNGDGEFVRSLLTSHIYDNLPNNLL